MSLLELLRAARELLATFKNPAISAYDKFLAFVAFAQLLIPLLPKDVPPGPHIVGAAPKCASECTCEEILDNLDKEVQKVGAVGRPDGHIIMALIAFLMKLAPFIIPFLGPKA